MDATKLRDDAITLAFCWAHVRLGFFGGTRYPGARPFGCRRRRRTAALARNTELGRDGRGFHWVRADAGVACGHLWAPVGMQGGMYRRTASCCSLTASLAAVDHSAGDWRAPSRIGAVASLRDERVKARTPSLQPLEQVLGGMNQLLTRTI
jgi:hypothetical protein